MEKIRRSKKRRPFKLTKSGWVFILYTVGIGAGAINTGNNLLYLVFGLFLGVILASGVLSDLSLWGLELDFSLNRDIFAGTTNTLPFRITNIKRFFPSLSFRFEVRGTLNGEPVRLSRFFSFLGKEETISSFLEWTPPRRGRLIISEFRFSTRFPFGLLVKWWPIPVAGNEKTVFPALVEDVSLVHWIDSMSLIGLEEVHRAGDGFTFFGLRDFRKDDHFRRIHWKSSAKRSSLGVAESTWLVKEMEDEENQSFTFFWPSPGWLSTLSAIEQEQFLSFVATILVQFEDQGSHPILIVSGLTLRGTDALTYLALFNFNQTTPEMGKGGIAPEGNRPPEGHMDLSMIYDDWKENT